MNTQQKKAEDFRKLHNQDSLLILPNIWDVLGAKVLEAEGFPAVATASASVAFSRGYDDNQEIAFAELLSVLKSICEASPLPVTADIERGYADTLSELEENTTNLLKAGVIGINIEDSLAGGQALDLLENQCDKIKVIRRKADQMGIPLFINARTDVFLMKSFAGDRVAEAIRRGQAFREAGADGFYPLFAAPASLPAINQAVGLPINVYALGEGPSIPELEQQKIARLSLGPTLLKSLLGKMIEVLRSIKAGGGMDTIIDKDLMSSKQILEIIKT